VGLDLILKHFPNLTDQQKTQFEALQALYFDWNSKINVISRKDIESLYEKHVLHSLAIAKFIQFADNTRILDIGTGGGFPGVPLAILFPHVSFTLCDSIAKKIKVAEEVSLAIGLTNIDFVIGRAEHLKEEFHFVVSRAVAPMEQLYKWTRTYIAEDCFNSKLNGYLLLKGGDLKEEIKELKQLSGKFHVQTTDLSTYFDTEFFETKKLVYIFRD
jgi:16S rRNA (guanine527-N7)-methyltransferase